MPRLLEVELNGSDPTRLWLRYWAEKAIAAAAAFAPHDDPEPVTAT